MSLSKKLKAFVRYAENKAVAGSLVIRHNIPTVGVWKQVNYDLCCDNVCPQCPECPECPTGICYTNNFTCNVTAEHIADATGNTGINALVGNYINGTTNNMVFYNIISCAGYNNVGGFSTPLTLSHCGVYMLVYYFKNDLPIFIPYINNGPCVL